ncbi:MAG: 4Fe-4S binding protein [Candidatus Coatesbacteria bacterium]|nr:4Fe-4S binding protein [Candidatus Coatesbacteria bacterium]
MKKKAISILIALLIFLLFVVCKEGNPFANNSFFVDNKAVIDPKRCIKDGKCIEECPEDAIF